MVIDANDYEIIRGLITPFHGGIQTNIPKVIVVQTMTSDVEIFSIDTEPVINITWNVDIRIKLVLYIYRESIIEQIGWGLNRQLYKT